MSDESNELVIPYKKGAAVKTLLGCLAFAAAAVWVASTTYNNPHKSIKLYIFLAIVPVAVFGLFLLAYGAARILYKRLPALIVDDTGVTSHSLNGSSNHHPWSQISGFALREEKLQRSTLLFLKVIGNTPDRKAICSINADELPHRPADVLYTLEELAAKYKQDGTSETSLSASPAKPFQWNYTTFATCGFIATFLLGVIMVSLPLMKQANYLMMAKEGGFEVAQDFADIDAALNKEPISQALKQAEPEKFEQFRQEMFQARRQGMGPEEFSNQVASKTDEIIESRLQHASPATLCAYFRLHFHRFEEIAEQSPTALYASLTGIGEVPDSVEQLSPESKKQYSSEIAKIITAPLSETPLPQDETLVKTRLQAIYQKLSADERVLLTKTQHGSLDLAQQESYCQAYLHFYREILQLPEVEAVQVLRSLEILPQDDRMTQEKS